MSRAALLGLALTAAPLLAAPARAADEPIVVAFGLDDVVDWFKKFRKKPDAPAAPAPPSPASAGVFRVVSWNMQTFGRRMNPQRRAAAEEAVRQIFGDAGAKVFAAQEIANDRGADVLQEMLSSGGQRWQRSFEDSADGMDNAFFAREGVEIVCSRPVFEDRGLSLHPARLAHIRVGDLDFTAVTLHLMFKSGRAAASVGELRNLLDWLREHLAKPGVDQDVMLLGDFNLTKAQVDAVAGEYPMFAGGNLVTLIEQPTSRNETGAARNYDHFVLSSRLHDGAYVRGSAARLPPELFEAIESRHGARISDHYPVSAEFRSGGPGIRVDGAQSCSR